MYRKLLIPFIAITFFTINIVQAQSLDWVKTITQEKLQSLQVDNANNIYISGFTGGIAPKTFLRKYNSLGKIIWKWNLDIPGPLTMVLDKHANIYLYGMVRPAGGGIKTYDFDPSGLVNNLQYNAIKGLIYIAKYDSSGNYLWAKSMTPIDKDFSLADLLVDDQGNLIALGLFQGSINFDINGGSFPSTCVGSSSFFACKYDSGGNLLWLNNDMPRGFYTVDRTGNLYQAYWFNDSVDVDPTNNKHMLYENDGTCLITKYGPQGNFIKSAQYGATQGSHGNVRVSDIGIDGRDSIYVLGDYQDSADFDPGPNTLKKYSNGDWDSYLIKTDSALNLGWARSIGGLGIEHPTDLYIKKVTGEAFLTGWFIGTIDFDADTPIVSAKAYDKADGFVIKYDRSGDLHWGIQYESHDNFYGPRHTVNDIFGNVYCLGNFEDTVDFDPQASMHVLVPAANTEEGFLQKIIDPLSVQKTEINDLNAVLYPNPVAAKEVHIVLDKQYKEIKVTLVNMSGSTIATEKFTHQKEFNYSIGTQPAGVYILNITGDGANSTVRLLVR